MSLQVKAHNGSSKPPVCCRFGRYTAVDIANVAYGLVKLGHRPSAAWVEAAQRRFRWGLVGRMVVMVWLLCAVAPV
jgi:hypothetical protein